MCEEESQLPFYRYTHVYNLTKHTGAHISFLVQRHRSISLRFCTWKHAGWLLAESKCTHLKAPEMFISICSPFGASGTASASFKWKEAASTPGFTLKKLAGLGNPWVNKWSVKTYERGVRGECGCSEEVCWNADSCCNRTAGSF